MYKVKPQFVDLELRGNINGKLILFKDLTQDEIASLDDLILAKYFVKVAAPKKPKKKKDVATNSK